MTISFHCDHCGKKIEAQDSAGGKWGKCPGCRKKVYVPSPDSDDELKLAPIDETEEQAKQRLMAETYRLTQDILQERQIPNGPVAEPISKQGEKELTKNIILYLRLMANGDLDQAEKTAVALPTHSRKASEILDRIALSEMPEPELADIPQQVLSGLIRSLRTRIC